MNHILLSGSAVIAPGLTHLCPFSVANPLSFPPPHTHTFRSLYLLSAIRASDDNIGRKCCHGNTISHILLPTPAFNPAVGPRQEQFLSNLRGSTTQKLEELEVASSGLSAH